MRTINCFIALGLSIAFCSIGEAATASTPKRLDAWKQLDQVVDLSDLRMETTFREAIKIIGDSTTPSLSIVVFWGDVNANSFVTGNTPIAMEGVNKISAKTGLELVLRAVSSRPNELGYTVQGGVVVVGTPANLPTRMYTKVYDISDLTAAPSYAQPGFGLGFGLGLFGNQGYGNFGGQFGNNNRGYGNYGRGNSFGGSNYSGNRGGYFGSGYGTRTNSTRRTTYSRSRRVRSTNRVYARTPSSGTRSVAATRNTHSPRRTSVNRPYPRSYSSSAAEELALLIRNSTQPRSGK